MIFFSSNYERLKILTMNIGPKMFRPGFSNEVHCRAWGSFENRNILLWDAIDMIR